MVRSREVTVSRRRSQRLRAKELADQTQSNDDVDSKPVDVLPTNDESARLLNGAVVTELEPPFSGILTEGVVSDEEEGPEDVSLAVSKQESLEIRRFEQEHIKRVDEAVKEKRRKKHELYKAQKVSKTITKFPEEVLEELSLKLAEQKSSKRAQKRFKKKLKHRLELMETSQPTEAIHGSIRVVALAEESTPEFAGQALTIDFRRQHFYGGRLKRLPALSIQAKKYRNRPAKNFVKPSS